MKPVAHTTAPATYPCLMQKSNEEARVAAAQRASQQEAESMRKQLARLEVELQAAAEAARQAEARLNKRARSKTPMKAQGLGGDPSRSKVGVSVIERRGNR